VKPIVANGLPRYAAASMLNDRSPPSRCSKPAARASRATWSRPGPRRGARAHPDHRRAHARPWQAVPWRFVTVADDQREALADLLARALPEHDPDATDAHYAKALEFAHQAPALVVLVSAPVRGHKIPVWEQQLSCGAAAMNLLLAAHALGFVGGWITGWAAYSSGPRAFCGARRADRRLHLPRHAGPPLEERPRPRWRRWCAAGPPPEGLTIALCCIMTA
jgi:nitroreductase